MSDGAARYDVPANLPIEGFAPGTSVLVAGPAMDAGQNLTLQLVRPATDGESAVVVTTDTGCARLVEAYESRHGEWPLEGSAFVDCSGPDPGDDAFGAPVRRLSSPGDLTGIGIAFSALVEDLYAEGRERVRLGLFSLNTLVMYADVQTVFRFGHTVAGRVASTAGLGVFFVDPSTQEETVVNTLSQFLDGRIDVREGEDGPELRTRGAVDGPSDWTGY